MKRNGQIQYESLVDGSLEVVALLNSFIAFGEEDQTNLWID